MFRRGKSVSVVLAGVFVLILLGPGPAGPKPSSVATGAGPASAVRVGLAGTLFQDVPHVLVLTGCRAFQGLMESQTGLKGDFVIEEEAGKLAEQLQKDQVQVAVFHGVEFAWARAKNPELKPLMIAVNQQRHLHALVLVRQDSKAGGFADLRGQALALPLRSPQHCRLFLQGRCRECGHAPQGFLSRLSSPACSEEALDDVVDGVVQAAVVDGVDLDCYQRRKPARFALLKDLHKSEEFPAVVVAYHAGALDEPTLERFRAGMINANQTIRGRHVLMLLRLTGFEAVPPDYEHTLAEIVKAYPAPACRSPSGRETNIADKVKDSKAGGQ